MLHALIEPESLAVEKTPKHHSNPPLPTLKSNIHIIHDPIIHYIDLKVLKGNTSPILFESVNSITSLSIPQPQLTLINTRRLACMLIENLLLLKLPSLLPRRILFFVRVYVFSALDEEFAPSGDALVVV